MLNAQLSLESRMHMRLAVVGVLATAAITPPVLHGQDDPRTMIGRQRQGAAFGDTITVDTLGPLGASLDPIGFLLEHRDSLHLADSVRTELVRLNLRLFRRSGGVRLRIDSLRPPASLAGGRPARPDSATQARLAPLYAELRAITNAARDTAWAMLSDPQRDTAQRLLERDRDRGPRMPGGPGRRPNRDVAG